MIQSLLKKSKLSLLVALLFCFFQSKAQVPVAYYDFEDNSNRNTTVETSLQESIAGIGSPTVTAASLTASNGAGRGAAYTPSGGSGYALGYYGFTKNVTTASTDLGIVLGPFNCTGLSTLSSSFDAIGIGTLRPTSLAVYYSLNGSTYTAATLSAGSTTIGTTYANRTFSLDAAANNAATLYIKIVGYNTASATLPTATNGPLRVDNFTLNSALITAALTIPSATNIGIGMSSGGTYTSNFGTVDINSGAGNIVALSSNANFTGTVNLTSGILSAGTNSLTFSVAATPIARTSGTLTVTSSTNITLGTATTLERGFTIPNNLFTSTTPSINNLIINRNNTADTVTLNNQPLTINGTLSLTRGRFYLSTGSVIFQNSNTPIDRVAGFISSSPAGSITFGTAGNTGGNAFTLPTSVFATSPLEIKNITIERTNSLSLNTVQTLNINGTLNLIAGDFIVGDKIITFKTGDEPIKRTAGKLSTTVHTHFVFGTSGNTAGAAFTLPNDVFTIPTVGGFTINRINKFTWNNQDPTFDSTVTLTTGILEFGNRSILFEKPIGGAYFTRAATLTAGTITLGTAANLTFSTAAANTTIPNNIFTDTVATVASVTINNGNGRRLQWGSNPIIITGNLNILSGTSLYTNSATGTITVQGNITGTGSQFEGGAGEIDITGTASTLSANIVYDNIEFNTTGSVSLTGTTTITGNLKATQGVLIVGANTLRFINSSTITKTGGLIRAGSTSHLVFDDGAAITLPGTLFEEPTSLASLTINRGDGIVVTWGSNPLTIVGDLTLSSGTLSTNGTVVAGVRRGDITVNGNILGDNGLHRSGSFATNGGVGKLIMTGNASTATIAGLSYGKLELNSSNGFDLAGNADINDSLILVSGSLNVGDNTLAINQNANRNPIIKSAGNIALSPGSSLSFGTSFYAATTTGTFTMPANLFTPTNPEITNLRVARRPALVFNAQNFGISGILSLDSGQITLPANYVFSLRSTSITNTAMVDVVGSKASISYGTGAIFRVERFIPKTGNGIRAFRDISPSVNSGTSTVFDNWQEGGTNGLSGGYYYGTHITGIASSAGGVDATSGLDKTASGYQSLYMMKINTTSGIAEWETQTTTKLSKDTLSALRGYRILIRGNRLMNLYQSPQPVDMNADAILRSKGKLIIGNVVYNTSGTTANGTTNTAVRLNFGNVNGFTMLGNPYAAPIVWDSIVNNSTNVQATYWIFDPNVGTEGAYVTYNTLTGSNNASSAANKYIQPGEAFFIKNNASLAPALTIKETFKAANAANLTLVYRNTNAATLSKISFLLKKQISGRGLVTMDGAVIAFDSSFNNTIGAEDGAKFSNATDNFGIVSNYTSLSVEGRKPATINDTMQLRVWAPVMGTTYTLVVDPSKYINAANLQAYLLDRFTNTQTLLSMTALTNYNFTVSADTASYNWRFKLVFKSNNVLPVKFISINAAKEKEAIKIDWTINENNMKNYAVERSLNGREFETIAIVASRGNGNNTYTSIDNKPLKANSYYRIAATDISGSKTYSPIVLVKAQATIESITVYPNPIKEKTINLQLSNVQHGVYTVEVINTNGQKVLSQSLQVTSNTQLNRLQLPTHTQQGTYLIRISSNNFTHQQKLIVE